MPLKEVSTSGLYRIEVAEVDLSQLLGGDTFTLLCTISNNGIGIKTTSLIDTGANGYTFINLNFARTIQTFLGVSSIRLKEPCKVRGFDGRQAASITHFLELMLELDSR